MNDDETDGVLESGDTGVPTQPELRGKTTPTAKGTSGQLSIFE